MTQPPPPATSLEPGHQLLPGYRVDEHLARGRALDVYAVHSTDRECLCVAKTLRPDCAHDTAARTRLLNEGKRLQQLTHPNLVRSYETVAHPHPTVILETLPGETLGHLIGRRRQALSAADIVELGLQLAAVLGYLHRHDTLHLDLKPSNIVVEAGRARLLDLSHALPPGPCPAGFGTHEYMPPEQLTGSDVTEASDIYGLGGVLYRAATRRHPFPDGDHDHHRRPKLSRLRRRRGLPTQLTQLISESLTTTPGNRPTLAQTTTTLRRLNNTDIPAGHADPEEPKTD